MNTFTMSPVAGPPAALKKIKGNATSLTRLAVMNSNGNTRQSLAATHLTLILGKPNSQSCRTKTSPKHRASDFRSQVTESRCFQLSALNHQLFAFPVTAEAPVWAEASA